MATIDTSGYVSEYTQKTLEQFGWKPGDPLIENLGEVIHVIRERTPPSKKAGLLLDIDMMSPADVELMQNVLAASKTAHVEEQRNAELKTHMATLTPGVQDAYAALARATGNDDAPEIVDDRAAPPITEFVPPPAADEPVAEAQEQETKKPDLSAETGVAQPNVFMPERPAFCPRCDWDLGRSYDVQITDIDKENFLAAILGGIRFKKEYKILNNRYTIIFRTLLAEENKKIHRQLVLEQRANEFFSDTEWFLRFFEYRLACSVETVIVNDKVVALIPEMDELDGQTLPNKKDDLSLPPLIRLHTYVIKELLSAEITRRVVSKNFREFQRLYEALEAMALEPNFW